jgi:hypothetical protein
MSDVTLPRSNSNNGTATPATTGSITAVAGNLLIVVITALGTSPTVATPTSAGTWTQIQNVTGSTVTTAVFMQANNAGGAINPSSVLGGTVTGWVAAIFEFTQTGANCGLQGSANRSANSATVTDVFSNQAGATIPQLLFIYAIGRATDVFTPAFTGLGPGGTSGWSASVQPQVGVQGISQDFYWGTNLSQGPGAWPTAPGTLATSTIWKSAGAWFNDTATPVGNVNDNVNGNQGSFVGPYYQGMIGG